MVNSRAGSQAAPGELERIRELLNTWLIPNDTRETTDRFDDYSRRHRLTHKNLTALRQLRDDLRACVERQPDSDTRINAWVAKSDVRVAVVDGRLALRHGDGPAGDMLLTVLEAMTSHQWERLKACPDCRWVFYDHTRNGSKRWCLMNAGGPDGRACGTIAKVRRHRNRAAQSNE